MGVRFSSFWKRFIVSLLAVFGSGKIMSCDRNGIVRDRMVCMYGVPDPVAMYGSPYIMERASLNGQVYCEGKAVSDVKVRLFVDGKEVDSCLTQSDGSYSVAVRNLYEEPQEVLVRIEGLSEDSEYQVFEQTVTINTDNNSLTMDFEIKKK